IGRAQRRQQQRVGLDPASHRVARRLDRQRHRVLVVAGDGALALARTDRGACEAEVGDVGSVSDDSSHGRSCSAGAAARPVHPPPGPAEGDRGPRAHLPPSKGSASWSTLTAMVTRRWRAGRRGHIDVAVDPADGCPYVARTDSERDAHAARRQAWTLAGGVLLLYALLRGVAGPLPQWPDYHDFADTRRLGFIPRPGDLLTNLAILAEGLWALSLRRRVVVTRDERPAYHLLVLGAILTAFGSAYYHWEPSNARLVWDRAPMAVLATGAVALVLS